MFRILKATNIDFTKKFKYTTPLSILFVCLGLYGLFTQMNYGVDFTGGAEIQIKFPEQIFLGDLREVLDENNQEVIVNSLGGPSDNEYIVKVSGTEENLNQIAESLRQTLSQAFTDNAPEIRKVDIVGPRAGANLRIAGFQAMFWALVAIMIYIGLRFDFKYSPGAIMALFHDVSIILGIFAFTKTEFTLQIVAALLAVIGYSVNDTVVVYDRVREHEKKYPERNLSSHINQAVNETLSRTILTSGTTLFVSLTMYFWGGSTIKDFFMAISLGVLVGTYSSIFVAAPVTLLFHRFKKEDMDGKNEVKV